MPKMKSKSSPTKTAKIPQMLFPRPPSPPKQRQKSTVKKRSKSATAPATAAAAKIFPNSEMPKTKTETKKSKTFVGATAPAPTKASKKVKASESKPPPPPPAKPSSPPKIDEQETSQMWILRHLRLHLEDINDSILANFVLQQDVTPFRNFMLDFNNERRCIFVYVCRQNQQLTVPPTIPEALFLNDIATTPRPSPAATSEPPPPPDPNHRPLDANKPSTVSPQKHQPGKLMKPKATKSKKRSKSKEISSKKISEKQEVENEKKEEAKRQIIEEIVQHEISAVPNQEGTLQLKWSNARKIPDETDEFVFVVSREAERMEEKSELDQSYFVGYCKNSRSFKRLIEIGTLILGSKMTFERQMDMLLFANNAMAGNPSGTREKWQSKIEKFENFICDSLGQAFWHSSENNGSQSRTDSILSLTEQQHSSVESVESLLRPRIYAFVKEANTTTRIRLWLELSLYELKFVKVEDSAKLTSDRITRIHAIFQTLTLLLAEKESISTKEWLQKALFYTIELFARIIGTNLKECVAELTADLFGESDTPLTVDPYVRGEIKPVFIEFIQIGLDDLYNPKSEEFGVLENIKQCLKIFDYIEEELEKMSKEVAYLRSPIHDMLIDRTPINNAFEILKNVWNMFQETYFESALESGNIETMKSVCLQISAEQEKLKALTDDLKHAS